MSSQAPILVVDDEPFIRRALTFVLNREGYETICAGDGVEALEAIRARRPSIVFLDVMMPRMDGYELCRTIRKDPAISRTHIILLTARGQEVDQREGMAAGADEFMTKPFSPSRIVARVRELAGRPESPAAAPAS